jgi:hypothetical protein
MNIIYRSITNWSEQTAWQADSSSPGRYISCILWNEKKCYNLLKSSYTGPQSESDESRERILGCDTVLRYMIARIFPPASRLRFSTLNMRLLRKLITICHTTRRQIPTRPHSSHSSRWESKISYRRNFSRPRSLAICLELISILSRLMRLDLLNDLFLPRVRLQFVNQYSSSNACYMLR